MRKKISLLFILLVIITSCSKKSIYDKKEIIDSSDNKTLTKIMESDSQINNFDTSRGIGLKEAIHNEQYLWTSDKGEYIKKEINGRVEVFVYPNIQTTIIESQTIINENNEELWYKILTPNNCEGWLKYNNQYICNEKNTNVLYNAILTDYCIKNNCLIEGDEDTGYTLFIGNPNCLMEIGNLSELDNYSKELFDIYSIYIYTKESLIFDGKLFPNLSNLYVVAKHAVIKNVNNLISLVLEEKENCELDFLLDCHDLQDLFVFSYEEIKLPNMSNLENISTVSILSRKQKTFNGIETIPCNFNFVFREKNVYLESLMMNNVDYSSFLNSNCIAFLIDNECYQKYSKNEEFVSLVTTMEADKDFVVSIVE